MGSKKHQNYTHGEIIEKLDDIEERVASVQRKHDVSQILAFAMGLAGFVVGFVSLSYAGPKELRSYFITVATLVAVATFIVLWLAGRMKD